MVWFGKYVYYFSTRYKIKCVPVCAELSVQLFFYRNEGVVYYFM